MSDMDSARVGSAASATASADRSAAPGQAGDVVARLLLRFWGFAPSNTEDRQLVIDAAKEIERLRAIMGAIGRRARSDGQCTFDDTIRDLAWIDGACRATLTPDQSVRRQPEG